MNNTQESFLHLQEIFEAYSQLYVWVIHYGITHHYMELAIHKGDYPKYTKLVCEDCFYFSGFTQGGPYRLKVTEYQDNQTNELTIIIISGYNDEFLVKCGGIRVSQIRG